MSRADNIRTAQQFLADVGASVDLKKIAERFRSDVIFEVQGDYGALPWIGTTRDRAAISGFIASLRSRLESIRLNVDEIVASDDRAIIVGDLVSRVKANGNVFNSAFAIILTFEGDLISRYQMLEDSFAVLRGREDERFAASSQNVPPAGLWTNAVPFKAVRHQPFPSR